MKKRYAKAAWGLAVAALVAGAAKLEAGSPTPAVLRVRVSGGAATVVVSNAVGNMWSVQYATSLAATNFWQVLTNVAPASNSFAFVDPSGPLTAQRYYRAIYVPTLTNAVVTNLVWIPPGTFVMGSPTNEVGRSSDETQHTVTLNQGLYMSPHLVEQGEYVAVLGYNPSHFNTNNYGTNLSGPVETVTWYGASGYCSELTLQQQSARQIPTNWAYRLPTESEWEYACRAGTTTEFSYGEDPTYTNLANYAWYELNSAGETHVVATLLPNAWGLYDMEGDVYEWCQDYYGPYPAGPVTDPQEASSSDDGAVVYRGGAWQYGPVDCRCAVRYSADPSEEYAVLGFRVVLAPVP